MSRYLALDWDQQLLHVVSGTISGTQCKIQKAAVWQESSSPNLAEAHDQGLILRTRLKEAGLAPAPVLAVVPRDAVILKDLRIPAVPAHEEPAIVRFQTIKELTHREEDIVLDYAVMHGPSTASMGSDRRVLAVVIRKEMAQAYQELASSAGLKLAGITPRPFGLSVGLQRLAGTVPDTVTPTAENAVALVLIAGRWGEFSVFRGDIPVLTRSINVSGNLGGELRRNLAVYAGQSPQHPVRSVYLCGDVSDDVRGALGAALPDLPLHTLDPFASMSQIQVPQQQRSGFLAAIGVLYARARRAGLPINFLEPRQPRAPGNPNRWLAYAGAAAVVLALGAGAVYGYLERTRADEELVKLQDDRKQIEALLAVEKEKGKKLQSLDTWDNINELAEMHELNRKIPDVDLLRIVRFKSDPLTRTPTSPHVAEITLFGEMLQESTGRAEIDKFIANIRKDPHYSVKAPGITGKYFTIKVKVEKRPLKSA